MSRRRLRVKASAIRSFGGSTDSVGVGTRLTGLIVPVN
jgi:hypothetical protein